MRGTCIKFGHLLSSISLMEVEFRASTIALLRRPFGVFHRGGQEKNAKTTTKTVYKTYRLKNVFSLSSSCTSRDLSPELDTRAEKAPSLRSNSLGGPNSTTLPGSTLHIGIGYHMLSLDINGPTHFVYFAIEPTIFEG